MSSTGEKEAKVAQDGLEKEMTRRGLNTDNSLDQENIQRLWR